MATSKPRDRLSANETLALWTEYKRTGDARLRDRLVLTFAPMVKYIVYRKIREIPARSQVSSTPSLRRRRARRSRSPRLSKSFFCGKYMGGCLDGMYHIIDEI